MLISPFQTELITALGTETSSTGAVLPALGIRLSAKAAPLLSPTLCPHHHHGTRALHSGTTFCFPKDPLNSQLLRATGHAVRSAGSNAREEEARVSGHCLPSQHPVLCRCSLRLRTCERSHTAPPSRGCVKMHGGDTSKGPNRCTVGVLTAAGGRGEDAKTAAVSEGGASGSEGTDTSQNRGHQEDERSEVLARPRRKGTPHALPVGP